MNLIYSVLGASFIALVAVGVWRELRLAAQRRRTGLDSPPYRRRTRRRLLGLLFLALSVALLANRSTFDRYVPNPFVRLSWIGIAFVSVLGAVWMAFRDLSETGKIAQEEAKRVVLESLASLQGEIARARKETLGNQRKSQARRPKDTNHRPPSENRPEPDGKGSRESQESQEP